MKRYKSSNFVKPRKEQQSEDRAEARKRCVNGPTVWMSGLSTVEPGSLLEILGSVITREVKTPKSWSSVWKRVVYGRDVVCERMQT